MEWNADLFFFARLLLLLSRAMSVLVQRSSMILLSWLPATWRISLPGLIPVRSSATSCVTVRSWMTLIFCDRLGFKKKSILGFCSDIPGACALWPVWVWRIDVS